MMGPTSTICWAFLLLLVVMSEAKSFSIHTKDGLIIWKEPVSLPSNTQTIHIETVGQAAENASYTYALAQISWQYNIKPGSAENVFEGRVEYTKISNKEMQLDICYRTKEVDLTGMVIIEATLPSGYDLTNKEKLSKIGTIYKVEREDSTVILYLNETFTTFTCYTLEASKVFEIQGHISLPVKIRFQIQTRPGIGDNVPNYRRE